MAWDAGKFAMLVNKAGGNVPKGGDLLLQLRGVLSQAVGADDACLIATYIGTGRSEANTSALEWGTQTAEDDCGTDKFWGGRTVAEAFDAAAATIPAGDFATLDAWAKGKAAAAKASVDANVKQDVNKIKDKVKDAATGAVAAAGFGAAAYVLGAAFLVWLATKAGK